MMALRVVKSSRAKRSILSNIGWGIFTATMGSSPVVPSRLGRGMAFNPICVEATFLPILNIYHKNVVVVYNTGAEAGYSTLRTYFSFGFV